jgi:adenylate cyclase
MVEEGFKRKLTAIFSTDVEGFSRLMGDDEAATVKTLESYKDIFKSLIIQSRGRVVDSPGDNLLAEFSSVVDAVQCAVAVQKELTSRNAELPEHRRMQFRIGVNLGDVIEEGDRIYGDGVNVAARLESLAEPGGICISKTAFDQIESKLPYGYDFIGEQTVKNIAKPIGAYRVLMDPRVLVSGKPIGEKRDLKRRAPIIIGAAAVLFIAIAAAIWQIYLHRPQLEPASVDKMAFPLPDKPSIAVLPFDNMSGDPEQGYIADGISENIITALSNISNMFVIARNSTFIYKDKPVKVQQVSEELGVRYVLEGSVQQFNDRIRITAQLIDALNGRHLWAEKYDRQLKELFNVLDEITKKIVVSLDVKLIGGEDTRLYASSTDNLEAWILLCRGDSLIWRFTKQDNVKAREFYEQAIQIDPNFVEAWSSLAATHGADIDGHYSESPVESFKQLVKCVQKALSLDDSNALAHRWLADIYFRKGNRQKAIEEGEKAIFLSPSSAYNYVAFGRIVHFSERPEEAINSIEKGMRLSPYYPASWLLFIARAYHQAGRFNDATSAYQKFLDRCQKGEAEPLRGHVGLVLSYLELGQDDEALKHASEVFKINPGYPFLSIAKRNLLYKDLQYLKNLLIPVTSMQAKPLDKEIFAHAEQPAFHLEYPKGSKSFPGDSTNVLMMRSPGGPAGFFTFGAGIDDVPKGMKLNEIGTEYYLSFLKPYGSNINVKSNREISLKDNTKAYRTEIEWLRLDGATWMSTTVVSVIKDGKWVYASAHTMGDPAEVAWIPESLTFD